MRFENEGLFLWYGTVDAPAPSESVQQGDEITLTTGVQPADADNKVEINYRVNRGPTRKISATWLRHDLSRNAQYFFARFSDLRVGDVAEYTAVCRCAGRQVPSPEDANKFISSFSVRAPQTEGGGAVHDAQVAQTKATSSKVPLPDTHPELRGLLADVEMELAGRDSGNGGNQIVRHIRGTIWTADMRPASSITVVAHIYDSSGPGTVLGTAQTAERGTYVIEYSADVLRQMSKQSADICLLVYADRERRTKLGTSRVLHSAPDEALLDFILPRLQSEYDTYMSRLGPMLRGRSLQELDDKAISELASKTGIEQNHLLLLTPSTRIALENQIPNTVVYGALRMGLGSSLDQLLGRTEGTIREALGKGQIANIIPSLDEETINAAIERLRFLRNMRAPLTDLAQPLGINTNNPIFSALAGKKVRTLGDVQKAGGLASVKDLGMSPDDPLLKQLDSHARLLTLQADVVANGKLIAKGYDSLAAVARATPNEISTALGLEVDSPVGKALQSAAALKGAFLRNLAIGDLADRANGLLAPVAQPVAGPPPVIVPPPVVVPPHCSCRDCDAAVSPRAYLADLMQYAITHLRLGEATIDLRFFKENFYQPFSDLPSNCSAEEKQVRQVRIAIEVLRGYLGARPLIPRDREDALKKAERQYLIDSYEQLLIKIGTNYAEMRLSRTATPRDQQALADRIGIPVGKLSFLLLDPDATPAQLTEPALEQIFGLADTTAFPLRDIPQPDLTTWRLSFIRESWKSKDWPNDDYSAKLLPIIDPDLIGPDDFRYPLLKASASEPDKAFDIWVKRRTWTDGLIKFLKAVAPRQTGGIAGPDFNGIVSAMGGAGYNGQSLQWPATALADVRDQLAAMTAENADTTAQALYTNYRVALDAARRIIELWEKDISFWKVPDRAPSVTDEEWDELYSTILRIEKNELLSAWIKEEADSVVARASRGEIQKVWIQDPDAGQVLLGPREFWKTTRNPILGKWPPERSNGIPLIDPEKIKLDDLPDPTAGARARTFWNQRNTILEAKAKALLNLLLTTGIESALTSALGAVPPPATSWAQYLGGLEQDLLGSDQAKAAAAKLTIEQTLRLTVETFERILGLVTSLSGSAPLPMPAQADLVIAVGILTTAWKLKTVYATWYAEEVAAATAVPAWLCFRHALGKWRAAPEERVLWQRALEQRQQPPVIDPDILSSSGYLQTPGQGDAWSIWNRRQTALAAKQQSLSQTLSGANRTAASLNSVADSEIAVGALDELAAAKKAGKAIATRLQQLDLSFDALDALLQVKDLLSANPLAPVLEAEWAAVCSILTEVWKERQISDWQLEERVRAVVLSQDYFKEVPVGAFGPVSPPPLDPWRGSQDALFNWQDTLQSRIDEEASVIASINAAVSDVEAQTLPPLRDALIVATNVPGSFPWHSARWLGDHLAIGMEDSGCEMTTRLSQAIETFQIILWSVRTGLFAASYPTLKLVAPDFDEEWKWIGSYTTWRAAMFVFLYPENILLPSLRRHQTPAFQKLIDTMRNTPRLTAARARMVAEQYANYARDIFTLTIEATPNATTYTDNGDRYMTYLFAKGGQSGTIYWSVLDSYSNAEYPFSFWDAVPGLDGKDATVIGADSYKLQNGQRYLYVFLQIDTPDGQQLAFNRYDLHARTWQQDISSLNPPDNVKRFTSALRQRGTDEAEPPVILFRTPDQLFYERGLNASGVDWRDGDWTPMDRAWAPWTSDSSTPKLGTNLLPGGRFFAGIIQFQFGLIAAPGKDGQVHGFYWYGPDPLTGQPGTLADSNVPPLAPGKGGITGVWRVAPSPNFNGAITDQIDLFTVGSDQKIYNTKWDIGWQTQWNLIGTGQAQSDSIVWATSRTSQIIDSYVVGLDNRIYQASWGKATNYTWTPWFDVLNGFFLLDLPFFHSLAVLSLSGKRLALLPMLAGGDVRDLLAVDWTGDKGWQLETPILVPNFDDVPMSAIMAVARRSEALFELFVSRTSGEIWAAARDVTASGWGDWQQIGDRSTRFSPATLVSPCSLSFDRLLVFATDQGGAIQNSWRRDGGNDGKWYHWAPVQLISAPAFARDGYVAAIKQDDWLFGSSLTLFAVAADGVLYWTQSPFWPDRYINYSLGQGSSIPNLAPGSTVSNIVITEQLSDADRTVRSSRVKSFYDANQSVSKSTLTYLEELFYFVPMHIARQLQQSGLHVAALDWLRLLYDYIAPSPQLVGLPPEAAGTTGQDYTRNIQTWLLDPLNPHSIAETRPHTYTRYTLLSIIDCLLAYADSEFTADTAETVPRARELYQRGLTLLDSADLRQTTSDCDLIIGELQISVDDPHWEWIMMYTLSILRNVSDITLLKSGVAKLRAAFAGDKSPEEKFKAALPVLNELSKNNSNPVPYGRRIDEATARLGMLESAVLAKAGVASALGTNTLAEIVNRPIPLPIGFWDTDSLFTFCIPPNPVLLALRMRAELNLYKIIKCRNIAGMERQLEPFAAPTDTSSGMPSIGSGGQLLLPGIIRLAPTPYRYSALIERAKVLTQQALQMEAAFLSALEKTDKEAYDLLNAKADVRLAQAGVRLQDLQLQEAQDGVKLAELQRDRSSIQSKTYQDWIDQGLSPDEHALMGLYDALEVFQVISVAAGATMQGITGGIQIGGTNFWAQFAYQAANAIKATSDVLAIDWQRQINKLNVLISLERRVQDWSLQKALADQDIRIGDQQVQISNDRVRASEQERTIQQMKADHAKEVLDFLTNKFTNKELYDWMSGVLQGVYSFFLQQATSVAQLAASELAFERQETPPSYIQADYWQAPSDSSAISVQSANAPDRRGLTGSARLLQDIYQLDQYAFDKNKRKQQLTKTISLRQQDPFAFQRFLETGILPFATPMELFDRDFPGHYLRLIKRVRTTLVALVPPNQGIRATLTSSGMSRVVVGGDLFQTVIVRRPPETLALSAAFNATGLFELQEQPDMLLPFEDLGAAATWEFALPKASNQFDYSTIADVLVAVDYTALNSFDYRQQVIQLLNANPTLSADRAFSFRMEFADAWYDLNNPDQSATPMSVTFETAREDFPPNIDNLRLAQVAVYFARPAGSKPEFATVDLRLEQQGGGSLGGTCSTVSGLVSTRSANGGGWLSLIDSAPGGKWHLTLPNTEEARSLFQSGSVTDILFVITFAGRLPAWPS